ncbi:MAG: HEAT repeat domain-containing protein, partial [Muribaculaceae bacterium]|nr:HEAT repeat domain-containing protein [Muribaculaceae bacterium]
HITGDPTYRFTSSVDGVDAYEILRTPYNEKQTLELLKSEYADVRSAALHRLWANGYNNLPELLVATFRTSPSPMERYTAMHLLEQLNGDEYRMILPEALDDTYEFIRRQAVSRMGKVGLDEYVPYLVKIYGDDNMSARITFNVEQAMQAFDGEVVEKALAGRTDDAAKALRKAHAKQTETNKSILGNEEGKKWRKLYISTLRNNPIHVTVPEYLAVINDPNEDEDVKLVMLDALAWYTLSNRRPEIIATCEAIMQQPDASKALKSAAERTYYRLKN